MTKNTAYFHRNEVFILTFNFKMEFMLRFQMVHSNHKIYAMLTSSCSRFINNGVL